MSDLTSTDPRPRIVTACAGFDGPVPHVPGAVRHPPVDFRFPDGEACADLPASAAGHAVTIFQTLTRPGVAPDEAILSLLVTARAYREHGAGPVSVVVPHLAYSRQDRNVAGQRRPVTAGLLADLVKTAGVDEVITVASGATTRLRTLFGPELVVLSTDEFVLGAIADAPAGSVLYAPDAGAAAQVERLSHATGLDHVVAHKERIGPSSVVTRLPGDVHVRPGAQVIVVDDLLSSGATLEAAISALPSHTAGHRRVCVVTPHIRLTPDGVARLSRLHAAGAIDRVHALDTIPSPAAAGLPFLTVERWTERVHAGWSDAARLATTTAG